MQLGDNHHLNYESFSHAPKVLCCSLFVNAAAEMWYRRVACFLKYKQMSSTKGSDMAIRQGKAGCHHDLEPTESIALVHRKNTLEVRGIVFECTKEECDFRNPMPEGGNALQFYPEYREK